MTNDSSAQPLPTDYWTRQLDQLKAQAAHSEGSLAALIGLSPAMLSHVRAGRRPMPMAARMRLLHHLGFEITRDLMIRMLPPDNAAAVLQIIAANPLQQLDESECNLGKELPPLPSTT